MTDEVGDLAIWRVLGIHPTHDRQAIKSAYRAKARLLHPDVNTEADAEARFSGLQSSYEAALMWAKTGADTFPPSPPSAADADGEKDWSQELGDTLSSMDFVKEPARTAAPPASGSQQPVPHFDAQLNDLFAPVASASSRQSQPSGERGSDLHVQMTIDFHEAFAGAKRLIRIDPLTRCELCRGAGSLRPKCDICSGMGTTSSGRCWNCHGRGYTQQATCSSCKGAGQVSTPEHVSVEVPPGTRQGTLLRVPGRGNGAKHAGRRGDLSVKIALTEHADFVFGPGNSLLMDLPIDVATAGLGGVKTITLPDGSTFDLKIPAMAGDRREIIVAGKGWPSADGAGDLRVRLNVGFPSALTQRMREALKAYQQAEQETKAPDTTQD